jgi:translation initiation factor 2 beta subunit (eIF-2beta)/eIF-5
VGAFPGITPANMNARFSPLHFFPEKEVRSEKMEDEEVNVAAMFDLSLKKKKKKKAKSEPIRIQDEHDGVMQDSKAENAFEETPPTYSYNLLLQRVFNLLHQNNLGLIEKTRFTMKPPQLMKVGTKKTLWVNYQEICKMMGRNPDHVFQFMMAELGTEGSIDGNQRLVIKGKFVPQYIESLLKKYIKEYVICKKHDDFIDFRSLSISIRPNVQKFQYKFDER